MPYALSYFVYSLLFVAVWLILFALRPDLRRDMLIISLVVMPLGPLSEIWYLRDYWQRPTITGYPISIEDALFAFAIGGAAFALHKVLFNQASLTGPARLRQPWLVAAAGVIVFGSTLLLTGLLGVNSIFSSILAFVLCSLIVWGVRPDLIRPSLSSALLSLLLFMIVYQLMRVVFPGALARWCTGCNPSGVMVLGVSLEEMLWDFSWGLLGGVIYDAALGRVLQKRPGAVAVPLRKL